MSFWKNLFGNQDQLLVAPIANEMGPTRDEFLAETLIDEEVPQKEIRAGEASECFHEVLHYAERDLYHDAMHETYRANGHLLLDERLQDLIEAFQKKLEVAILKLQGVADDLGVHEATFNAAGYLENALMFANKRKGIEREISFLKTALEDSYSRKGLVRNRLESFKRGFYQAKFEVVQSSLT
jgi:hypothetical protein